MTPLFGHTRTHVAMRHALIAPDGHVPSTFPGWDGATAHVILSPAMGADLAVRDRALLEQPHEERARDPQQIRRLLGRELCMDRDKLHRVAFCHVRQDGAEQLDGLVRKLDLEPFPAPLCQQAHALARAPENIEDCRGLCRGLGRRELQVRIAHEHLPRIRIIRNNRTIRNRSVKPPA